MRRSTLIMVLLVLFIAGVFLAVGVFREIYTQRGTVFPSAFGNDKYASVIIIVFLWGVGRLLLAEFWDLIKGFRRRGGRNRLGKK